MVGETGNCRFIGLVPTHGTNLPLTFETSKYFSIIILLIQKKNYEFMSKVSGQNNSNPNHNLWQTPSRLQSVVVQAQLKHTQTRSVMRYSYTDAGINVTS